VGRYVRDGAAGLAGASVAWFGAEVARADQVACLISCGAACVLAVVMVEVLAVARRRVEALQAAMLAEVAARFRKDGKWHGASHEPAGPSGIGGARAQEAAELRALANEGAALRVRLGDWRRGEAPLADDMARAVAFWERRARWALRGHRVEWVAFGGAVGQDRFAVTVSGARDRIEAQVRLLLSVAAELDGMTPDGDGQAR
jgi:hypothetical protein